MSKPLVILEQDKSLLGLFDDMRSEVSSDVERMNQLVNELHSLQEKTNSIKKRHWILIKKYLFDKGLIDGLDVEVMLKDGVVYQVPAQPKDIKEFLGKLFGDGFSFEE